MCIEALIQVTFRGEKGTPQLITIDSMDQVDSKIKDAQSRPEAMIIDVFIHSPALSIKRIEQWRTREEMREAGNASNEAKP